MKLVYFNDGKEKDTSHEIELVLDWSETNVMSASKENAIEEMRVKIKVLIKQLQELDVTSPDTMRLR